MKSISTSTTINASPEKVWKALTDFASYPDWNPFVISASGKPEVGNSLNIRISPPGGKQMSFKPVVLAAKPNEELRWKGRLILPGIFDGEHFFQLKGTTDGTELTQGENFSGLLVSLLGSGVFKNTEKGFNEMNAALKQRAESESTE